MAGTIVIGSTHCLNIYCIMVHCLLPAMQHSKDNRHLRLAYCRAIEGLNLVYEVNRFPCS